MPPPDEIMMPVAKAEAVAMAEINAMRQVADTLRVLSDAVSAQGKAQAEQSAASTKAMERLTDKVEGMNTRLIRLEEAKHGREIERLESAINRLEQRVNDLEGVKDRHDGALSVGGWITKHAPWLVAVLMAGLAAIGFRNGAG